MKCSAVDFGDIGLAKYIAAYQSYCRANGIKVEADADKNAYTKYLELKDSLAPVLERNADKLKAARELVKNGNSSRASSPYKR